jgi:hypothetical protein
MKDDCTKEAARGTGIEEPGRLPFEIVAAYEDAAARERTVALCQRLEEQLGTDCEFKCAWWGLENLRDAQSLEQAASEAAEAKMIIVSLRDQQEFPPALKDWCEAWAARRRGHKAALVALVAGTASDAQSIGPLQRALEELAKRTRLDFFLCWFATRSTPGSVIARQSAPINPAPSEPADQKAAFRQPTPRWGINE